MRHHIILIELTVGHIHCQSESIAGYSLAPTLQLAAHGIDRVPSYSNRETDIFGHGKQIAKAIDCTVCPAPAEQGLKTIYQASGQPVDRLIPELELTLVEHVAQLTFPLLLAGDVHFHIPVEYFVTVAAVLFGAIHSEISVAKEQFGIQMVLAGHGNANAGEPLDMVTEDFERTIKLLQYAPGDSVEIGDGEDVFNEDSEFVAAEPGCCILRPQNSAESLGNRNQQNISRSVAEAVVDLLEVIEIEKEYTAALVTASSTAVQGQCQSVFEERPIGQAGEHVMHGIVLQFGLDLLALANIAISEHKACFVTRDHQRSHVHGHIDQLSGLGHAHRFDHRAALLLDQSLQHRILMLAGLGNDEVAQIAATHLFSGEAKHARECRVGIEHMGAVHDDDGLRDAGQDVLHQPWSRSSLFASGVGNDDRLTQPDIQGAVCAFYRHKPAALACQGCMKRAA